MRTSHLPHLIIGLLVLSACTAPPSQPEDQDMDAPAQQPVEESADSEEQLIGGQRDEHGCLGPAGYGYDEEIGACIRIWELDETKRKAARIAVESLDPAEGLTVLEVTPLFCEGCFGVTLQNGDEQMTVFLEN